MTWNTTDPDFTPCFQKTLLVWVPCLFLWTFTPLELFFLKRFHRWPLNKNLLNQSKLVLLLIIILTQTVDYFSVLYHHYEGTPFPYVDFYTPVIYFVTFALCLGLHVFQFKVGRHTSGILFLFWLLLSICNVVKFRSAVRKAMHDQNYASSLSFITFQIYFFCCLTELLLSFFADVSHSVRTRHVVEKCSPEETASFCSRTTFSWFDRFAWTGFRRPITTDDLWTLRYEYKTCNVNERFERAWSKEVHKAKKSDRKHTPHNIMSPSYESLPESNEKEAYKMSVANALMRTFGFSFFTRTSLKVCADLCGLATPLLLQQLIGFVESNDPFWQGMVYVVLLSVSAIMESLFVNQFYDGVMIMSLQLKSALISAIYKKSLKISNSSKTTSTVGEIVNLMSVDAQRMSEMMVDLPEVFTAPIQIGIAVYMLYRVLGVSALIGLSIILVFGPINAVLARKIEKLELLTMEYKDERVKIMNEILAGMKVLKLYAWEPSFCDKINAIRKKEIDTMKKLVWLNSGLWFLFNCAPYLISLTMFTSYVLLDETHVLNASTAFVSLSVLHIIQEPLSFAPIMIAVVIQMRVSIKRLNDFMNLEELNSDQIDHDHTADAIKVDDGTFAWKEDGVPILADISFSVPKGCLVAVVGIVGSGKSSLMSALLGEMEKVNGSVNTFGTIAYVPQIAWIQNATLKNNILFGKKLEETTYESVIDACALRPDLEVLPGGDMTEIGEKGINLSGGQKQRVSLGRAVYNNADIYLLDDPLSAVDSHVGKHIFDEVIGPNGLLKNKTRVLVTHGLVHLPEADSIIVMDKGKIVEMGSYAALIDSKGVLYDLIKSSQREKNSNLVNTEETVIGDSMNVGSPYSTKSDGERYMRQISKVSVKSLSSEDGSTVDGILYRTKFNRQPSHQDIEPAKPLKASLISEETIETGRVDWDVYYHYFKAVGKKRWIITIVMFAAAWGMAAGTNVWLSKWANDNDPKNTELRNLRLGIYGGLNAIQSILTFIGYVLAGVAALRTAQILHNSMLQQVLRAPMSFFDITPLGRIINRFSHDVDTVDATIPNILIFLMELFFQLVGIIVVICISTPIIAAVFVPVGALYYFTQKFYISTSRQLKRIASNFRSPIYSHFSETLSGLSVIRAFKVEEAFMEESNKKVDANHKAVYPSYSARRWLTVRLDFLGTIIIFFTALFSVLNRHSIDAGTLGLSVSYALTITFVFNWLAKMVSELETYIVSVERIKEYSETPSEAEWRKAIESIDPDWPNYGAVTFENYSTRYRDGLDLVLKGISCQVESGEKIGIVGRTGAGKSSLTLALFRLVEAADGKILIDNVNIGTLGLHTLRSSLTIIPQDPVLFCGTLRMNLDPFEKYTDQEIWYALEHSHLKQFVSGLEEGLQHDVAEGGENLSVGQRQLLCLARALLRKTKVLVLDEATAAVDLETDELIQLTIRKEFAECTVFTIAHRLNTILDNTRILVLQNGLIEEFDSPTNLLQNTNSIFYSMARDAGLVN